MNELQVEVTRLEEENLKLKQKCREVTIPPFSLVPYKTMKILQFYVSPSMFWSFLKHPFLTVLLTTV